MEKKDIGALWEKTAKSGIKFLSGYIEVAGQKVEVVCFSNKKDGNDRRPDWRVMPSEKREQGTSSDIPF